MLNYGVKINGVRHEPPGTIKLTEEQAAPLVGKSITLIHEGGIAGPEAAPPVRVVEQMVPDVDSHAKAERALVDATTKKGRKG